MFEFVQRFFGKPSSSATAKERLRLVLLSDHLSLAPDVVEALKRDLVEVISRYVQVDSANCDVTFEQQDKQVAMLANIPILGMHTRPNPPPTPAPPSVPPPSSPATAPPPAQSSSFGPAAGASAALAHEPQAEPPASSIGASAAVAHEPEHQPELDLAAQGPAAGAQSRGQRRRRRKRAAATGSASPQPT